MVSNLNCPYFAERLVPHVAARRYWEDQLSAPFVRALAKIIPENMLDAFADPLDDSYPPATAEELKLQWENNQHRLISEGYRTLEEQIAINFAIKVRDEWPRPQDGIVSRPVFDALLTERITKAHEHFEPYPFGAWNRRYVLKKEFAKTAVSVYRRGIYENLAPENPIILFNQLELTCHGDLVGLKRIIYAPRQAHAR